MAPRNRFPPQKRLWAAALLVAVFSAVVYLPVLRADFVDLDDYPYVLENQVVRDGITGKGILWAFRSLDEANWHPLTWISHMADVEFFGLRPPGHHITSLVMHVASAVLLLLALVTMTGAAGRSAFVAALFALHPLHVESVAWVSERKDVLSGLFFMLTLNLYARYARRPSAGRYFAVAVSFSLGLMAKPMVVTLPLLLLLMDFWPLRRFDALPARVAGSPGVAWMRLALEKTPLFLLAAASAVITVVAQRRGMSVLSLEEIPIASRLANAVVSYGAYLWKAFWPSRLAVFYPHPGASLAWWKPALSGLLLIGLGTAAVRSRAKLCYPLVGWLWYLVTLVPVIGLVQIGNQAMADRYTYLPLIGPFIVLAWGGVGLVDRRHHPERLLAPALTLLLCVLGAMTLRQAGTWRDSETLFRHAIETVRGNWPAHQYLGTVYHFQRKPAMAAEQYLKALEFKPDLAMAQYNLGIACQELGRWREALDHLGAAARSPNPPADIHLQMARVLIRLGLSQEARAEYELAFRRDPASGEVLLALGLLYKEAGEVQGARDMLQRLRWLDPVRARVLEAALR